MRSSLLSWKPKKRLNEQNIFMILISGQIAYGSATRLSGVGDCGGVV